MPRPRTDYTGTRFGALTCIAPTGENNARGVRLWLIRCDCGVELRSAPKNVRRNKSCGCLRTTLLSEARTTHGMSQRPGYKVWSSMLDRCHLSTHQAWHNYGGRGITVCEEWQTSFDAFWRDMGPTYQPALQLDRRDNMAGYCPQNCRWVSPQVNSQNTRKTRSLETPWGPLPVAEAARRSGLNQSTLHYRLNAGWPMSMIFATPDYGNASLCAAPKKASPS